jgi:hypothetical protein
MNWESYLINQLEQYCCKAQDQGYKFSFGWLFIFVTFVAWKILEGETFLEVEPSEPLATRFNTLWYLINMVK